MNYGSLVAILKGAFGFADKAYVVKKAEFSIKNSIGGNLLGDNSAYTTGWTGIRSSRLKVEAEAPFTAVRIGIGFKTTSGTPPTFKAVIAPTDTLEFNTVAKALTPQKSGVTYNSLATTDYGFRAVTFGGNATGTPAFATGANNAQYLLSDWMPCVSLPRSDVVGGRPAAVAVITQSTVAAETTSMLNGNTVITAYQAARGRDWYRELISTSSTTDDVGTLTNLPANLNTQAMMFCWLEFQYAQPTRSVSISGDSTHSLAAADYGLNNFIRTAVLSLSTQQAPITHCLLGGSGHSQTQFLQLLDNYLNAGGVLTDVFLQGWSQNGFTQTIFGADTSTSRLSEKLRQLRVRGVKVWMTTGYVVNGYSGIAETARQKCIAQVKAWGASGLVTVIDTDAIITDYTVSPPLIKAIYNSGDNVHANQLGQDAMSAAVKAAFALSL